MKPCFVFRPVTRLRHIRNDDGFSSVLINAITSGSVTPYWACIASKVVRSSQAISMILSISSG
ncbi:hypothetical protein SynA15127_01491 [Synechococcus sp. A15-127]|nr:hypothetical protein SynA15127_01491 [Synechococcus sp. A15-127]